MILPYGTDAPIYHRPVGTVAIIIINLAMFLATGMGEATGWGFFGEPRFRWLILEFDRINPLQWVTAAFMHASWMHLIGNMIFLWCFGIVVEGKLGLKKYSLLYLGLCLADGAIAQVPMFMIADDSMRQSGALGASGVIFALIAVAMCWAPENDMHCIFAWSFWFIRQIDVPIFFVGLFYFAKEMLPMLILGFHISTPMLHLLGMFVGFPFAIIMLRWNMVDCEGWDIVSRWNKSRRDPLLFWGRIVTRNKSESLLASAYDRSEGREALKEIMDNPAAYNPPATKSPPARKSPECRPKLVQQRQAVSVVSSRADQLQRLTQAIRESDVGAASEAFRLLSDQWGTHAIGDNVLAKYAELLSKHGRHVDSIAPLYSLVSRRSKFRNLACLRIARIQLEIQHDPELAAATLRQMVRPWSDQTEKKRRWLSESIEGKRMSRA